MSINVNDVNSLQCPNIWPVWIIQPKKTCREIYALTPSKLSKTTYIIATIFCFFLIQINNGDHI